MNKKATLPQHGITKEEWEQFHDLWEKIRPLYKTIYTLKCRISDSNYFENAVIISSHRHQSGPNEVITGPRYDPNWGEMYADEDNEVWYGDLEFPAETEMRLHKQIEDKERKSAELMQKRRRDQYEALKKEFEHDDRK